MNIYKKQSFKNGDTPVTQQEITHIVNTYYSDKIQLATLDSMTLNFLLFKILSSGLKQFKGYSTDLTGKPFDTEQDVKNVIDVVITENSDWFNS